MFSIFALIRKYNCICAILFFFTNTIFASNLYSYRNLNSTHFTQSHLASLLQQKALSGRLMEGSCTGEKSATFCIAVGYANNNGKYPLLMVSTRAGDIYTVENSITNFAIKGTLLSSSCVGSDRTAFCVASGFLGDSEENGKPYLIQSKNGGANWEKVTVAGSMNFGLYKKVKCTGSTPHARCIAVGFGNNDQSANKYPLLAESIDNGKTWFTKPIKDISSSTKGKLYSASCTGDGNDAMCVAIGDYQPFSSTIPLLIQNTDGNTWVNKKFLFLSPLNLTFTDVNCTGKNAAPICTVVGRIGTKDPLFNPVIYQTKDRGSNWIQLPLGNFPTNWNGTLNSIACSGDVTNPDCATVGVSSLKPFLKTNSTTTFPLILQDKGSKWFIPLITNATRDWHTLYSTTCNKGENNFCFAVGFALNKNTSTPILTIKNGDNWQAIPIENPPNEGKLVNTSCNQSGSACIAVGYSKNMDEQPLIIASLDDGNTWLNKTNVINCPPPNKYDSVSCDGTGKNCVAASYNWAAYYTQGNCLWRSAGRLYDGLGSWMEVKCSRDFSACVIVGMKSDGWGETITAMSAYSYTGGKEWAVQELSWLNVSTCRATDVYSYANLKSVDTTDPEGNNWVAVGICQTKGGLSLISKDRGKSWMLSSTQPSAELNEVSCNYSKNCTAYSSDNIIYKSTDGGNTWNVERNFL